jgi:shikimate dehydrogenase
MQNAGIKALGLNWRYVAFDVHPDHLREAIAGAKAMNFMGLNLTVPHKLLALELVDDLDESAKRWGAVNTIRFEKVLPSGERVGLADCDPGVEGPIRTRGFNTDADAIIRSLEEDLRVTLRGSSVLLLGAGGAGRVAALKLAEAQVRKLYLVNRTVSKAVQLADEIRSRFGGTECVVGYPVEKVDLALNATSLGLNSADGLPFEPDQFHLRNAASVYDMIYRPAETPFLRLAREAGCRVANGMGMLVYQGAKALEIWSGRAAPVEVMREALMKHLYPGGV